MIRSRPVISSASLEKSSLRVGTQRNLRNVFSSRQCEEKVFIRRHGHTHDADG